jgi:hypothetical protein
LELVSDFLGQAKYLRGFSQEDVGSPKLFGGSTRVEQGFFIKGWGNSAGFL